MKLEAVCDPTTESLTIASPKNGETVTADSRRLPYENGAFAVLEVRDLPAPGAWTYADAALEEWRRVLDPSGLLQLRTRAVPASPADTAHEQSSAMRALAQVLQKHGFQIVAMEPAAADSTCLFATALLADSCREMAAPPRTPHQPANVTFQAPVLDGSLESSSNRGLVLELDGDGVRVQARPIFEILDVVYGD